MTTDADAHVGTAAAGPASETPREAAIRLARSGAPLSVAQFMAILGCSETTFHRRQKRGDFDRFRMKGNLGPYRRYSGVLVTRWLDGEAVYVPTFAGRRK